MSKLMNTPLATAASRIGSSRVIRSRIEPSVSIGSTFAESEDTLIETLQRGIAPR